MVDLTTFFTCNQSKGIDLMSLRVYNIWCYYWCLVPEQNAEVPQFFLPGLATLEAASFQPS